MTKASDPGDLDVRAAQRVAAVADAMGEVLTELGRTLHSELAESIPEFRGDPLMLELLRASTESNVETFLHVARYEISLEDVSAPSAAIEHARRLAQRGTSSNTLLRAYRLGQHRVTDWLYAEIGRQEPDGHVAFAAAQTLQRTIFAYVDLVAEQVVAEYEVERERWLANRNTVRTTTLTSVLSGEEIDIGSGETALGYRLRQDHLGIVAWANDRTSSTAELRKLEQLVASIADMLGSTGQPLFIPQDRSLGWGWIPLGRNSATLDLTPIQKLVEKAGATTRIAIGAPANGISGFRSTHLEAQRAHTVATVAGEQAARVTPYSDSGVRAASLLAADLDAARRLVSDALGGLAADNEASERLRDTLLIFLSEKSSYLATSERVHLHKNTVKYRVDKAVEARGRALDDDRLELELALIACRWLGRAVLPDQT